MLGQASRFCLIAAALLGLLGCPSSPDVIRDIRVLVQDSTFYLGGSTADSELVAPRYQDLSNEIYDSKLFSPWHEGKPSCSRNTVTSAFRRHLSRPGFGENGRKHSRDWILGLWDNADTETYPNSSFRAITIAHSNLRVLPTYEPQLPEAPKPGLREPFDDFQNTSISVNTPLYVSHESRDKQWFYADSHCGSGWIPAHAVARVDADFVNKWERARQMAIVKDGLPLFDEKGVFLFEVSLGSQFPSAGETLDAHRILVAVADEEGNARMKRVPVSKNSAFPKPLKLTPANVARLANELLNKPYGWGGLDRKRDCSAMLKDLFAPFGLWLPRHSSSQATEGGVFVDLSPYAPEKKEQIILERGIPYFTLIWAKGHIMLYIGEHNDQALVFHSFWGVRTKDFWGREGRKVVGHSAITTLHPGADLYNADPKQDLLARVKGMTILGPPREDQIASEKGFCPDADETEAPFH